MSSPIRVVTDSTAGVPADAGLAVVALTVVISPVTQGVAGRAGTPPVEQGLEGIEITQDDVLRFLGERRSVVTTSRPAPEEFAAAYRKLLDDGASGVVSVHLSSRLSGTVESAQLAAREFGERVRVVDTRAAGSAVGFVALAAHEAARAGGGLEAVVAAAESAAGRVTTLFYVDTLEFLRRGGRINFASALFGTAFAVKPILHVAEGEIVVRDKVRTSARALSRLVDLAVEAASAGDTAPGGVDVAVQHLGAAERARTLLDELTQRLGPAVGKGFVADVGAVVGAHTGPGVIGVTVYHHD